MTMGLLTLFQLLETLAAYLFVTLAVPGFVLSPRLKGRRFLERVLFYFIAGNFYAVNLVLLLQTVHFSNFFTLFVGLFVIPLTVRIRADRIPIADTLRSVEHFCRKVRNRSLGIKGAREIVVREVRTRIAAVLNRIVRAVRGNWPDFLLTGIMCLLVVRAYGTRLLTEMGYGASDIPVHLYWVNGLAENRIFVAGIYPFGLHAVIYLINTVFGIDSYVLFRVFSLVQCLAFHMTALLFLRLCCKSRYAPYLGIFLYSGASFISRLNIGRFIATLPQETSMVYIFPTAYFALLFFRERHRELAEGGSDKASILALIGLVMSFSMSVTTHFYGAIVAAIACVGIGLSHLGWLVRPDYFKRLAVAALISIVIAVFPMAVAYLSGTPLQGSMGWGMSVISQTDGSQAAASASQGGGALLGNLSLPPLWEWPRAFGDFLEDFWIAGGSRIASYVFDGESETTAKYSTVVRYAIIFLLAAGAVCMVTRRGRMRGAVLLSMGLCSLMMLLLFSADRLGLPPLMDSSRSSMFFTYLLVVMTGLIVDICACVVTWGFKDGGPRDVLSFVMSVAVLIGLWRGGLMRDPSRIAGVSALETDEAITCLSNIVASEPDYSWTIFSANDETQMVFGHGYHYELITFLLEIENLSEDMVTVPTETVYFFIEKIPVNYTVAYSGSGQAVSEEGARGTLAEAIGLWPYQGENRWILMSRMYYWALEFQKLHPNDMQVYMETDNFICWRLEQNPFRLFDLAIDYRFNSAGSEV